MFNKGRHQFPYIVLIRNNAPVTRRVSIRKAEIQAELLPSDGAVRN